MSEFVVPEQICVESIGGRFYMWKTIYYEIPLPEELSEGLNKRIDEFINAWKRIGTGQSEKIEDLCKRFLRFISKLFINSRFDQEELVGKVVGLYNQIQTELANLKIGAMQHVLECLKADMAFTPTAKRYFSKDVTLDDSENSFFNEIFLMNELSQDATSKILLKHFKEFIVMYDSDTETFINRVIEAELEVYENKLKIFSDFNIIELRKYLCKCLEIKCQKLEVLMKELSEDSYWELAYCEVFATEEMQLKQVLSIGQDSILVSIGFEQTHQLLLLSIVNFQTSQAVETLLDDNTAVIASGSTCQEIVFFKNLTKTCVLAMITQERKLIELTKYSVYSDRVDQVISGCYLKSTRDLLYISASGGIEQTNTLLSLKLSMSQIAPKRYFKIAVSNCERFITLQSENDIYLFDIMMKLIGSDNSDPVYNTLTSKLWTLYYVNEDKFEYKAIDLLDTKIYQNFPMVNDFERKIYYQAKSTLDLGTSLVKKLFQRRSESVIEQKCPNSLLKSIIFE